MKGNYSDILPGSNQFRRIDVKGVPCDTLNFIESLDAARVEEFGAPMGPGEFARRDAEYGGIAKSWGYDWDPKSACGNQKDQAVRECAIGAAGERGTQQLCE